MEQIFLFLLLATPSPRPSPKPKGSYLGGFTVAPLTATHPGPLPKGEGVTFKFLAR